MTFRDNLSPFFAPQNVFNDLDRFHIIAFTHQNLALDQVGALHLDDSIRQSKLTNLKDSLNLHELMFLSTCNRVEFFFTTPKDVDHDFLRDFFTVFAPSWDNQKLETYVGAAEIHSGINAVEHAFRVASSLDSMVVGEREIITQVRNAFETSKDDNLTGDFIRLVVNKTIETAKSVYTDTDIAKNPVSVTSLAYRELTTLNVPLDAKILVVGAGQTNRSMTKFFHKHGFTNFSVFNRTKSKADEMAQELGGRSYALSSLKDYAGGFDVIMTCTGSDNHIITKDIYELLVDGDTSKKIVIDLAIPNDFDEAITNNYPVHYIQVSSLKKTAEENIKIREKELQKCEQIIQQKLAAFDKVQRERKLELALKGVPKAVKDIHAKAISEVFAKDIETLDDASKEVLNKVLAYVEKKYISVPMKMAREILIENE